MADKKTVLLLVSVSAIGILYVGIAAKVAYTLTHIERAAIERTPAELGLAFSEEEFTTNDGITLAGWRIKPAGKSSIHVTFVHGIGVHRAQHHHLEMAKYLAGQGIASLLFDLRGHGQSSGTIVSGGFFEQRDVIAAAAQTQNADCHIMFGSSLGGAAALLAAEKIGERVDGVIVDSAYANIADLLQSEIQRRTSLPDSIAKALVPGAAFIARHVYGIDTTTMIPAQATAHLPYPILIIHGERDSRIPPEQSVLLHQAARPGSELVSIAQAEHTQAYVTAPDTYRTAVDHYIQSICSPDS